MTSAKRDAEIRSSVWRLLAGLRGLIEPELERALQSEHRLSVVEYTVLDALSRQDGWHMRMHELARVAALSSSATTRLVDRLEHRGLLQRVLCDDDRRGIYTELTESAQALLTAARSTHDLVLSETLGTAARTPELAPLAAAWQRLSAGVELREPGVESALSSRP